MVFKALISNNRNMSSEGGEPGKHAIVIKNVILPEIYNI